MLSLRFDLTCFTDRTYSKLVGVGKLGGSEVCSAVSYYPIGNHPAGRPACQCSTTASSDPYSDANSCRARCHAKQWTDHKSSIGSNSSAENCRMRARATVQYSRYIYCARDLLPHQGRSFIKRHVTIGMCDNLRDALSGQFAHDC